MITNPSTWTGSSLLFTSGSFLDSSSADISVSVVNEDGFKTMVRGFTKRPSLQIPCRKTMAKPATHTAVVAREKLKAMLHGEDLCLTCHSWTPGNGLSMLGVTGHWTDNDWKLVCACFDVSELERSHNDVR